MTTIAVLGVGRVGPAIARTAIDAGYQVNVAASGAVDDIELLAEVLIPGARAMTAADAVRDADVVVLAVPMHRHRTVDPAPLAGKIVVDAMNYWEAVDGAMPELTADPRSTSEVVADHLAGARVVKTLNHIGYHDLEEHGTPSGTPGRRALAVASDDEPAAREVMDVVDRLGFDPVYSGPLATGAAFEPGTRIFSDPYSSDELRRELTSALPAEAERVGHL